MAKYFFAGVELDTDRHELLVAGRPRRTEPQVFDLLKLLAERGNDLVSRDELIERVWHGRVITDSAISVRINAARKAVGDDGKKQAIIETVPRRGFRLAVEVRGEGEDTILSAPVPRTQTAEPEPTGTGDHPTLAVFRFERGDNGHCPEYLSRGIADDIATELSRFRAITVISTCSTFKHDTAVDDTGSFAASLGATHVITGGIHASDTHIRLTVRLSEVATHKTIWAEHYDVDRAQIFDAQDDAVANIVGNLFSRLHDDQMAMARRKPTTNLGAYDCVLRGLKIYRQGEVTMDDARQALFWFERAVELDPYYARALAWRACAGANFWSNPPTPEDLNEPMNSMITACSVDPGDHEVHRLKGALHVITGEHELGDYHLSKSVELNPNDAHILLRIGYYKSYIGDRGNDLSYVDLALKRNPLHPDWYWHDRGVVLFAHGQYEESLNSLRRCPGEIEAGEVYQAACCEALGEHAAASAILERVRQGNRAMSLDWIRRAYPYRCYKEEQSIRTLTGLLAAAGLE